MTMAPVMSLISFHSVYTSIVPYLHQIKLMVDASAVVLFKQQILLHLLYSICVVRTDEVVQSIQAYCTSLIGAL